MSKLSEADIKSNLAAELKNLGLRVRQEQNLPPNFSFKGKQKLRPDFNCDVTDHNQLVTNALILIEVKTEPKDHNKAIYQLDGYMKNLLYLSEDTNVIGLAVSGEGPTRKIDTFLKLRGHKDVTNMNVHTLYTAQQYYTDVLRHEQKQAALEINQSIITAFATDLGKDIQTKLGIDDSNYPLLISAIMLCLHDTSFKKMYGNHNSMTVLLGSMQHTINNLLLTRNIPTYKAQVLTQEYAHIWNNTSLKRRNVFNLISIIHKVHDTLYLALDAPHDIFGMFYSKFLNLATNKNSLGIVLTPEHCCEFMVDLIDLTVDSKVVDPCCGTGSFLIAAMSAMLNMTNDEEKKEHIKSKQVMGIELHNKIYALACANMILRGDGHSNLFNTSCLVNADGSPHAERDFIKNSLQPDRLLINPPYSLNQKGANPGLDEYEFILQSLDLLQPNGVGAVIFPMSKCISSFRYIENFKKRLLEKHTLRAVISMPPQLFAGVASVTCVMVVEAHTPHNPKKTTFFGRMKDDGFYTSKSQRSEREPGLWNTIKTKMLNAYWNKENIPELTINKAVTYKDEWCAEAYIDSRASESPDDLANVIRDNILFLISEVGISG